MDVADRIRAAIRERGPITFAEYMDLALYAPGGYFEGAPVGTSGDFVTSPHVHPVFGQHLARAIRELHDGLGRPDPLRIAEAGAGDGTLARQLIEALGDLPVDYVGVERSAAGRASLGHVAGVRASTTLPDAPHVVVANELLDNLPFRRIRGDREIRVGLDGDRLVEVDAPWEGEPGPPDVETVVPAGPLDLVDELAGRLSPGYALLIDYGGLGSSGGPVHGYRAHRVVDDLLAGPGSTDITSGVDFELLERRAVDRGLVAFPTVTQRDALLSLGFEKWLHEELARQQRQLEERDGVEAVRTWSGRSRATLLVDPTALGRLRWMLLASPGLPEPNWLERARGAN